MSGNKCACSWKSLKSIWQSETSVLVAE